MGYGKPLMTSLIIHSTLVLSFLATVADLANGQYRWKTGQYIICGQSLSGQAGIHDIYPVVTIMSDRFPRGFYIIQYEPYSQ